MEGEARASSIEQKGVDESNLICSSFNEELRTGEPEAQYRVIFFVLRPSTGQETLGRSSFVGISVPIGGCNRLFESLHSPRLAFVGLLG